MFWQYLQPFVVRKISYIEIRLTWPDSIGSTNFVRYTEGFGVLRLATWKFACTLIG